VRVRYREEPAALSERAQKVFQLADQEAHRANHPAVGVEHLLLGIAKEAISPAAVALAAVGLPLATLRQRVEAGRPRKKPSPSVLPHTEEVAAVRDEAVGSADSSGSVTPQVLLGLLLDRPGGVVAELLRGHPIARWRLRRHLRAYVVS
jgi:ATP-dependent Clp protease ATP-binding subunit ClpC